MQTSPISNPVNALSNPSPAAGRSDANASGASFDQVLSQEVAERATPPSAPSGKGAGESHSPAAQSASTAARPSKQSETKSSKGQAQDDNAAVEEGVDVVAQAAQDILALVAGLAPATQAAPDTSVDQATAETSGLLVPQDPLAAAAAAIAAAAAPGIPQAAGQAAAKVAVEADALAGSGPRKPGIALMPAADVAMAASPRLEAAASTDADALSAAPLTELANADAFAGTAATASASSASDFAAMMKESLSVAASMQPAQMVQQAANAGLQHTSSASDKLTPPVGTPAWDQALGQKVVWMVAGEQQSASLTLNPPDLGPLQVVLNVSNSQANATFIAAQPEVRQALEAALPRLRDMLGEAGIQLGQASVNSGSPNQQGNTDQQGTPSSQSARGERFQEVPVQTGRIPVPSSGQGLVDTFV